MKKVTQSHINRIFSHFLIFLVLMVISFVGFSQNVGINSTGSAPNTAAGLDVNFPDKGVLIPRVALTGTANFAPLTAHVAGMIVFNTATAGDVIPGFYYDDGTKWIPGFPSGNIMGNMLYWSGTAWVMISVGLPGQFLQLNASGIPFWGGGAFATIITTPATAITGTSATTGGNITSDGGSPILSRGVCYSTAPGPTTANSIVLASPSTGIGVFSCNLVGLTPATTYYVRAYGTNSSVTSYGNEISFTTLAVVPTLAATTPATAITATTAVSGGNVTNNGGSPITERGILINTAGSPTLLTPNTIKIIDGAPGIGSFISNITGLVPGTHYYYASSYATNSAGTGYGAQIFFSTALLVTSTTAANTISATSASTGGVLAPFGTANFAWQYGVAYSLTSNAVSPTFVQTGTYPTIAGITYVTNLTGLTANTLYYIRAYAETTFGVISFGPELSFTTTTPIAPTVTTSAISAITASTATSGGDVTSDGGTPILARGLCWSTATGPTTADSFTIDAGTTGLYASYMTGLLGSTTYYVRAYATNSAGTSYGNELNFITCNTPYYTVGQIAEGGVIYYVDCTGMKGLVAALTDQGTNIPWGCEGVATGATGTAIYSGATNTAAIIGNCTTIGIAAQLCSTYNGGGLTDWYLPSIDELQELYVQMNLIPGLITSGVNSSYWSSTEISPTIADSWFFNGGSGYLTAALKGFGSQINARAIRTWTKAAALATITTTLPVATGLTTGTSGGTISANGGAQVTARGVCWATTASPVATGNHTTDGVGNGTYVSSITGLTVNILYHVRAYATNSAGTAYGADLTFTPGHATVSTDTITNLAPTTATSGGTVLGDGGNTVTARGVCWALTANPVATGLHTTDGTGTGHFVSSVTGLTIGATYHLRAYATNSGGTSYGSEVIFTPVAVGAPSVVTASVIFNKIGAIAESGGTVVSEGSATVTAFGVVWSTASGPTITTHAGGGITSDPTVITGITPWTYYPELTGLTLGTTYHLRAYATNSIGTAYGDEIIFTETAATAGQVLSGGAMLGTIFNVTNAGLHGLIADPWGYGTSDWGCIGTHAGANGTIVGTGSANTAAINANITANSCVSTSPMAAYAAQIVLYDGPLWYLPSSAEFDLLWTNRAVEPSLDANLAIAAALAPFWTSSEVNTTTSTPVWYFDATLPTPALVNTGLKSALYNVWPIRSF